MRQAIRTSLLVQNPALRQALLSQLSRMGTGWFDVVPLGPTSYLVVTTAADVTPERCAMLAREGRQVIVLAAVPGEREREAFLASGAIAYAAMDGDAAALQDIVLGALCASGHSGREA